MYLDLGLVLISPRWEMSFPDVRLSKSVRVFTQSRQYLLRERFVPPQLLLLLFWEKPISIIYVGTIHSFFFFFVFFFWKSYPKPLSLLMRFQKIHSWIWVYKNFNFNFSISFFFFFLYCFLLEREWWGEVMINVYPTSVLFLTQEEKNLRFIKTLLNGT